jgi:2-polyprenyl-3-methyl-5-hydroxy-6-metoxy-1,4-benzoquinol methylase
MDSEFKWKELTRLRKKAKVATAEFLGGYEEQVESYRRCITSGIESVLSDLRQEVCDISSGNDVCERLITQTTEYVRWLQWSLWDLPYFAVVLQPPPDRFRRAVAACGLVYLSARLFDDIVDRHFWYKTEQPTLLSATSEDFPGEYGAEGLTLLSGLLLCFEGFLRLTSSEDDELKRMLQPAIDSMRRTVIGAIMEHSSCEEWDRAYYERLVQLKNVDYWRTLYTSIDPERTSPLHPFLSLYYTLAQYLNDVQDFSEDQARGQPNLLSFYLAESDNGGSPHVVLDNQSLPTISSDAEAFLANTFLKLEHMANTLPHPEHLVAYSKLGESLERAYQFGLFADIGASTEEGKREQGTLVEPSGPRLDLHWYSNLQDVIEQAGSEALVHVGCPACHSADGSYMFRKHGFAFHRCIECTHVYVSPRISASLQAQIGEIQDSPEIDDPYLEVQKIYAVAICQLLRSRAPGSRLLDIGFGRGYLMELAQGYGFEVYGVDSSKALVDRLWPHMGRRVHQAVIGQDDIPWSSFDVVVASHILEHMTDPMAMLGQVRSIMNPRAVLYIAVPDIDSMPFKVFGKEWDVVNPLVHFQYFTEASLSKLLNQCGFENVERITYPEMPARLSSRWTRLMKQISGSDSSDLLFIAQAPEE